MKNREDIKAMKRARREAMQRGELDLREKVDTRRHDDPHKARRNWRKEISWED